MADWRTRQLVVYRRMSLIHGDNCETSRTELSEVEWSVKESDWKKYKLLEMN